MVFKIFSNSFSHVGEMAKQYTCQGEDISPHLKWDHAPDGTKSFALIVDDPDAPDPEAPQMTWVHWVLYNIPANCSELVEDIQKLPEGTNIGINDWKKAAYGGPCPPIGRHRYYHKLYAVDIILPQIDNPTKEAVLGMIKDHILAETVIMGTYQKI